MSADSERLYKEGVAAIRAGDKATARTKLMQVVDIDQTHEQAWLWLSAAVETNDDRIICLQNVLTINPNNEAARKGLVKLGASTAVDTNIAGFSEEPPVAEKLEPAPSHRMEHASSRIAESLQMSTPERDLLAPAGTRIEPASTPNSTLLPDESWRAALLDESRDAALPNNAKYLRDNKGQREPRGFLDLVSTWGDMLIFRMGEFEREYRNAGFGHVAINIVTAGILQGIILLLVVLIVSTILRGGSQLPIMRSLFDFLGPEAVTELGLHDLIASGTDYGSLVITALVTSGASIPILFVTVMIEAFVLDRVCGFLKGRGDIMQTLHAISIVMVVQQIAQIPIMLAVPFVSLTGALYLFGGIWLYQFLLKARAVGKVQEFGMLIGIGALIISSAAMGILSGVCSFLFSFLAAIGSAG